MRRDFSTLADSSESESILRVEYKAATNRMLRVAVNSFFDSLALVVEVMEELDVDMIEPVSAPGGENS